MLAIDPRREFLSRRISKLDKRILRCIEKKPGASDEVRRQLEQEIQELRQERAEAVELSGKIPRFETSDWVLCGVSKGPPGGSAETSATRRRLAQGGRGGLDQDGEGYL